MEVQITAVYAKILLMKLNSNPISITDLKKELNRKIKSEDIDYSIDQLEKEGAIRVIDSNKLEVIQ